MSELFKNDEPAKESRPKPKSRWFSNLGWTTAGAVLAILLVADPLNIHPVDTWLHEMLGHNRETTEVLAADTAPGQKQLWTCGMHPDVISEEPGTCPICGMNLVPLNAGGSQAANATKPSGERQIAFYQNPMDPTITSPVPSKDEMGMDYVPVYEDELDEVKGGGTTVTIDPAVVQNMNVRVATVERRDLAKEIRTVGYLEYDQQKMVSVTTKYGGWIEKTFVNYVGEPVRKGEPLFQIYSPELVQTQQELLSSLGFAERMKDAPVEAKQRAERLVEAARQRLSYWDITPAQIAKFEETGSTVRTLTVVSPATGVVMMRMPGLEGMAVRPGMELFHIADLSTLWLSAEVFEDQLAWLRPGSRATVTLNYFPGETFEGIVRYIDPQVTEKTRTVSLKLEVPNRDGRLRAGMFATATFDPVAGKNVLAVPTLAVLRTGQRNIAVVAEGEGRFTPREIKIGVQGEQYVEVLDGLREGEQIVTSSQFLLDSESNLREAIQKLISSRKAPSSKSTAMEGHDHAE